MATRLFGFAGINLVLDEAHVANIAVRKDLRRKHIGSRLLEALIDFSKEHASSLTLEVSTENAPAIHLYDKYGFSSIGRRKKYYNNKFDAFIMTKIF